jgi:1-acyl-sn-glycerol-3-phosphate acyltransferase
MSDWFHQFVRGLGRHAFWLSSSPVVIGAEQTRRDGGYLLAAGNHQSPYDIPLLMRHCARNIDFLSISEVYSNPFVAWFYTSMNAFPLDRSRRDPAAVLTIVRRLQRGRVVCIFPEGRFRRGRESVLHARRIQSGIGRIAKAASVPIIPCVIVNSIAYSRVTSWLPIRRTRYGIAFGEPMPPLDDPAETEAKLVEEFVRLRAMLPDFG